MGAFEQLFSPVRGEFEQKISKNSNAWGVAPGDVVASIWLVHYVESDFGTTDITDKSFTVFFAHWGIKFDRWLKISARWVTWLDYWVTCAVEAKGKLVTILFCGFWFPCFNAIWVDLDVTLHDDSSFGKLKIRVIKNVSFSFMVEQRINSEVKIKVLCEAHERPTGTGC